MEAPDRRRLTAACATARLQVADDEP